MPWRIWRKTASGLFEHLKHLLSCSTICTYNLGQRQFLYGIYHRLPQFIQSQGKLIKIYLEASRSRYLNRSHCSMGQWELGHPALVQPRAAPVWSAVFTGGHGGISCSPPFCQLQQLQGGGRPGSPGSAPAVAVPSEFPFNGSDILTDCQGASGCGCLHAGAQ